MSNNNNNGNIVKKAYRYLTDRDYRFTIDRNRGKYDDMPDDIYLKRLFRLKLGRELDLNNPVTFNEKIQWLKLNDRKEIYTTMVDKYEVKRYVASQIGEEYIIPTLGVWDNADDIDPESLPDQFVLKCTHDSNSIVICKNKAEFDWKAAKKRLSTGLKRNYYYRSREWPYKNVRPRIIAEKYMEDPSLGELRDYKFFCFNGVPRMYKIDFNRFVYHQANYYDLNSNFVKVGEAIYPPDENIILNPPHNLKQMIEFAGKLSESTYFVRVDFYEVDGKIYFGEITFFPFTGLINFAYEGNDEMLGSWIRLPYEEHDGE